MKRKISIAIVLAMILTLTFTSLAFAADPAAHVEFQTDSPCAVTVQVLSYTNPVSQSGKTASGSTPGILDTYPSTSVTFFYPTMVVCNGTTYNWVSASPGNPVISGSADSTTTVTGHYALPDTTPPVLTLPDNMTVLASDASGAVVSFTASANDLVDGPVPVDCSPASGSQFPIGTTTVDCSATDSHNNTANGSFTITVQLATTDGQCKGVPGHQILPPIKSDGSSVFKQGRTVPAKFRVCDTDGKPITTEGLVTDFKLIQIISQGSVSDVNQDVLSANSHDEFRAGARQWIFNISTKNLTAGNTYVYLITLNDGSTIQFQFTLK
jgi:hypothetical protein